MEQNSYNRRYSAETLNKIKGKTHDELIELAKSEDFITKMAIIDNCGGSAYIYEALAKDPDPKIRIEIANRCNDTKYICALIRLENDKNRSVRVAAERQSYRNTYKSFTKYQYH